MSRSGYVDDFDDDLTMGRWRGIIASASRGKRGQRFFRSLLAALDAMPEKRLIPYELEENGEVCALGALGRARGIDMSKLDPEEPEQVAAVFDIAPQLAQETVFMNDEYFDHCTPEQRWEKMRKWTEAQIRP
jgi:hypothetical protein